MEGRLTGRTCGGSTMAGSEPSTPDRKSYRLRFARLRGPKGTAAPPVFFFNGGPAHWEDLWWLYDGGLGTINTRSQKLPREICAPARSKGHSRSAGIFLQWRAGSLGGLVVALRWRARNHQHQIAKATA